MITGFNSEARYKDVIFHVQTEDRGKRAARIDTIIYRSGGAVVRRKTISYKDILNSDLLETAIKELMEEIHHSTIREVEHGLWTLGSDYTTTKTLRSVLLKYLTEPESTTGLC